MIFPAKEFDAGESLHVNSMLAIHHAFNGERERRNPLNFEICNFNKFCKAVRANHASV
jgi:hypothetical protein